MDFLIYMIHKFLWRLKSVFGHLFYKETKELENVSK